MTPSIDHQERKRVCRQRLRSLRRNLEPSFSKQAAQAAAQHLFASPPWQRARHIGLYLANDGEMTTRFISEEAWRAGKALYLPCIEGKSLQFRAWSQSEVLVSNRYGIGEPGPAAQICVSLDLLLMPVVGWAPDGTRLGMGGGYYDRFLADEGARAWRLGLAFEAQREDELQELQDPWDQGLHGLATERGFYEFARDSRRA